MSLRIVLVASLAIGLAGRARPAAQASSTALFTPSIEFEKTHFAPTDHVFFWIVVTTAPHVLLAHGGEGHVTVARPDGSVRIDRVTDPLDMMYGVVTDPVTGQTHNEGGGWKGGWGLGDEKSQLGRYTVVFDYRGVSSAPASFVVEDAPILRSIHAEITLPSPLTRTTTAPASLLVRNDTDQPIQFPKFLGGWHMVRTGSVSVTLVDADRQAFYEIPESLLLPAQQLTPVASEPSSLRWDTLSQVSMVRLAPGASYRLDLPLDKVLSRSPDAAGSRTARQDDSTPPVGCRLTITATLKVFVGEAGGPWADFGPFDLEASRTGTLSAQPPGPCAGSAHLLIH